MNRLYSLKRILTFIIAFAVTAGIAGSSYNSSLKITSADTESSQGEDYSYTVYRRVGQLHHNAFGIRQLL